MTKRHIGLLLAGAALVVAALTGCGNHGNNNASVVQPTGPADVIQFPYGFRNVAHKCDGPNMVYSLSAGQSDDLPGAVAVVPNDPRCTRAAR